MRRTKKPSELRAGDRTEWYTINSVINKDGKIIADITWHDGGNGKREWAADSIQDLKIVNW